MTRGAGSASSIGVLLTPGAGTGADHPSLVAIGAHLAATKASIPVRRMDFPYRLADRRAPDRAPVLIDAVRAGASSFADDLGIAPAKLVLGGRSMGGRMCSMAIAGGLPALGLVCICYPLHPPGKPERLRIEHLPDITVPCLFVSGTRDAFGTPDELRAHTSVIPAEVEHHWIDGAGHDLKGHDQRIAEVISAWVVALVRPLR